MKKILLAASLAAVLPLLFSCGKVNENDNDFKEPRFVQYAGQLVPSYPDPAPTSRALTKAGGEAALLTHIVFTESGVYAVGEKDGDGTSYRSGTYNVTGDTYNMAGFGSVTFPHASPGTVDVDINPSSGPVQRIKAEFKKNTDSNPLYSGWTIDKTRVTLTGKSIGADFKGCNFYEIIKFLNQNGCGVPDDVSPSLAINSISFTATGLLLIAYSNGSSDAATYKFTDESNFTFNWVDDKMGYTFLTQRGNVAFMDGKCILTINVEIKDPAVAGTMAFVLSQMK